MKARLLFSAALLASALSSAYAQSELYPKHFDLEQVTLLDSPMKTAMELNFSTLMQYDVDRLLTPYVRQSGLAATTDTKSPYYQWEKLHPTFPNWGGADGFNLDGHVGGHYLSALALAYAACRDEAMKTQLYDRLQYMLQVMKDCQDQYDQNTEGLYGFIGGQPINDSWKKLYKGDLSGIRGNWGWVPFYCQHKILAGLRDAFLYAQSGQAKAMFQKLADWSINVVSKVSDSDLQGFLDCEHGGMNESLLDAYQLFGDAKYLAGAKRFTHQTMLNGMQTQNKTFLDGRHANTQVPKYIGMERIFEQDATLTSYQKAAENFWTDVTQNRTVCIGGNSVSEHFLAASAANRYIDRLDGPESCNTNNMLKLSEMMNDRTGDAKYADFYEYAMWNHILSTQDPTTGGYVYFTTLRPQGYRIYSQVNKGMWCCVGTGMENHSKYGHFIYTHEGSKTLYVNLFTPSRLESADFIVTQQTLFPCINTAASNIPTPQTATTEITVEKAGTYTIAVRHPAWAGAEYGVQVNGTAVNQAVTKGVASYVNINRTWKVGDKITVWLPMELKYVECPNYTDYIAFTFGPILLAAQTTAASADEAAATGLVYEQLQNEYGDEGRMDHDPASKASSKNLLTAPLLIGSRASVLSLIEPQDLSKLTFTIDASRKGVETYKWSTLTMRPFYQIHHARYQCYWYQQTAENFANSSMAQTEAANEALAGRTLDFAAPGEQQNEAGHLGNHSGDSSTGNYNGESYRDAKAGGYVEYTLYNSEGVTENLSIMCRFTTADNGRKGSLMVDGVKIADVVVTSSAKNVDNGFYNIEYAIPASVATNKGKAKDKFVVRLQADQGTMNPGLYYMRLMKDYNPQANAYQFRASDWTTGDAGRIPASSITYDNERNVIKAKATGNNNIALMMKYQDLDYDIDKDQKFMVVRGINLRTTSPYSYLWWLNGSNHGTQVAPTTQKSITVGGQQQALIAWNMSTSGIYENFTGDRPSVCIGQTIFGLTASSTDGSCEIHDINFVADVAQYEQTATGIGAAYHSATSTTPAVYDLQGRKVARDKTGKGIYISKGNKYVK
ncbi:MAG: glycoside hydrolase family 127 protein [Prevotella sp.]|nr:glycoside hydrolase family 127 protein [Prevotella sp.]